MPGRHGKGAHVSRAGEITTIPPDLERRPVRNARENRMTHSRSELSAEHHEVSALIPWYVNESLDEAARKRVDAHVDACANCRDDLAVQRRICEGIHAQPALDYMPVASLKRLLGRLEFQQA